MISAHQVTTFISEYSSIAGPVLFTVALLGSLLGTNLITPSGSILTAAGVLVGASVVHWTIALWAATGASLGMSVSFSFGTRLSPRPRNIRLLSTWRNLMVRAEIAFKRYGFLSILVAYFSGPLRAPVACVAAIYGMPRAQFETANILSSLIWASTAIVIGVVPGSAISLDSYWLIGAPVVVPILMVPISASILYIYRKC